MPLVLVRRRVRVRRLRTSALVPPSAPCPVCGREVTVLTALQAVRLLQVDGPGLQALLEDGAVHSLPTVSGFTWICRDSIFQRLP